MISYLHHQLLEIAGGVIGVAALAAIAAALGLTARFALKGAAAARRFFRSESA